MCGYVLGPKLYAGTVGRASTRALAAEVGSWHFQRTVATPQVSLGSRVGSVSRPVLLSVVGAVAGMALAPIAFTTDEIREFFRRPPLE